MLIKMARNKCYFPDNTIPSRRKRIRNAFFTRLRLDSENWVCKCGSQEKNTGTGCRNLVIHILSQHPDDCKTCLADLSQSAASNNTHTLIIYKTKTFQVDGWFELGINGYSLLCIVKWSIPSCIPIPSNTIQGTFKIQNSSYKKIRTGKKGLLSSKFDLFFDD